MSWDAAESEAEYERDSCVHIDPPPEGGCLACGAGVPGLSRTSDFITRQALLVQKTESLRRRLRQDEKWQTRDEGIVKIEDMSRSHAQNLIAWLARRGPALYWGQCATFLFMPEPGGDMAQLFLEQEQNELHSMKWDEWLARQPLVSALVRRLQS